MTMPENSPGTMPQASPTPPAAKSDKRKQTIIVIASIAGVLLTYLIYRRSKTTSSTASTVLATPTASSAGVGASDATNTALTGIADQLGTLTSDLTQAATPSTPADSFDPTGGGGIVKNTAGTGSLWEILTNGDLYHLTGSQFAVLQSEGLGWNGVSYNDPVAAAAVATPTPPAQVSNTIVGKAVVQGTPTVATTPLASNQSVP